MAGKSFCDMMNCDFELLIYFDKRQILNNMKSECEAYLDQLNEKTVSKFPPFRYLLEVDVMDLVELFPKLGEQLMKEPLKWQRYCNDILYACIKTSDNEMNQHVQISQVAVNIRLKSFPHVLSNPKLRKYAGIDTFKGLLVNMSKPTSYVYHTVWSCPEDCEGNEIILQFIPKASPKCYLCRSNLFENSGLRRCGDQAEATFKFNNDLLPRKYVIVDDLIQKLKLGATYYINAIVFKKATAVWCLEEAVTHPAPVTSPVPPDIQKLFDAYCDRKPWKFIYCLASSIGIQVCPFSCFMHVKINLLLSLASVRAHNSCGATIVNCLAAGHDTGYVAALMNQWSLLADPSVVLGTSNSSVAPSLIAASGGVCVMPLPLQVYSQKQIHSVVSAIETGEFQHETNKVKLNCAVWAQGMDFKRIVLYDVARVFGTLCRGDYGEYTDELADFILQQAMETSTTVEDKQALHDVSVYIDLVAGIKVSMDEDTQQRLSNYFLAARREGTKAVSVGNMESLVATCAMSARLCRRSVTNIDDAVFAIWLHVGGMADPRLAPEEYLDTPNDIEKLNTVFANFTDWLEKFTVYK